LGAAASAASAATAPADAAPAVVARASPLLTLAGMSKRFGSLQALDQVSLEIAAGEIHCLLGENGAGKSTLCNLIFGVYRPDAGEMRFLGRPHRPAGPAEALAEGIAMVHQHFSLVGDLSVVDNLLLGQAKGILRRRECAERVVALSAHYGLALDPWARINDLSVGERQRVEIVKCLMREPRLLVLDEPTAVLLPAEITGLLAVCDRVAAQGCSVVLVTHKLAEIKQVAHRVTVLRGGRVVAQSSEPAAEIDRLVRAMIQRDLERLDASASAMLGETVASSPAEAPEAEVSRALGNEALQVDGLTVRDAAGVTRLDNFTLVVNRGEIVGIAGVEGNGQSELVEMLLGLIHPTAGSVTLDGEDITAWSTQRRRAHGIAFVPEDRHRQALLLSAPLWENRVLGHQWSHALFRRGFLRRRFARDDTARIMREYDVRAPGPETLAGALSGGNQQKLIIGRELEAGPSVLVAAHPTRGVDVGAQAAIWDRIRDARSDGLATLLISADLEELIGLSDTLYVILRGRLVARLDPATVTPEDLGSYMTGAGGHDGGVPAVDPQPAPPTDPKGSPA
jgi:simple sugar transport system ATP-binding protein